ncbi:fatty acyl-AMP ligase [Streptomyces tubbatahanensis]|uniref:Fatty acyl-AMP ligase n=1 Tax=Streptomyces tubbatahanensis TaxID=2923272 RepID=A0ABY3XKX1_9ACTN|nr:fatty acyl-AMP ligase [Streptomyces tubbatahanensis]UNS95071.1 fatty acyl-AMP ligase [Streptomyces tubbatahanensis]
MGYTMTEHVERAAALSTLLRGHARDHGEREAVVFVHDALKAEALTLTYAQLDRRAALIAASVRADAAPGDRVLLLYPQSAECVAAFLGCLYAGVVAVVAPLPGNYRQDRRRLSSIAADAGISSVLTDTANLPGVQEWLGSTEWSGLRAVATDRLTDGAGLVPEPADRSTLALLQYTSGSTSDPKGVEVTHGNLLHNVMAFARAISPDAPMRVGGWAPLYHDMGLILQTLAPLALASTAVLMSAVTFVKRPYLWLKMIDDFDVTCSAAPNFAHALCVDKVTDEQLAALDLSRWRYAVSGAEPVQVSTARRFVRRFATAGLRDDAFSPCYGLAEGTVFVSGASRRALTVARADPESLERGELRRVASEAPGRELPSNGMVRDFDVCVVDPETRAELPEGRIGEIWLRGPSVARGYWGRTEATAETFGAHTTAGNGPFLRTGDLGTLLDGELYVTGRRKDLLIINGRNLHPQDVEHALREDHSVLEGLPGAVFTVPLRNGASARGDEALVVLQEVRGRPSADSARVLAHTLRDTVSREFGVRAAGVALLRRAAVRRTTSGKVQRAAMRDLFLSGGVEPLFAEYDAALETAVAAGEGRPA